MAAVIPTHVPGAPVAIATSDWGPEDQFSMAALAQGRLVLTKDDCPVLRGSTRGALPLVWPRGFTAYLAKNGVMKIIDPQARTLRTQSTGSH